MARITAVPIAQGANNIITTVPTTSQLRSLATALQGKSIPRAATVDINWSTGSCGSGASVNDVLGYLNAGRYFVDYGAWPWGSCPVTPYSLGGGGFGQFLYQANIDLGKATGYTGSGDIRALGVSASAGVAVAAAVAGAVVGVTEGAAAVGAGGAAAAGEASAGAAGTALFANPLLSAAAKGAVPQAAVGWLGIATKLGASLGLGAATFAAATSGLIARAAQLDPYSFAVANWNFGGALGYPYGYGLITTTNLANSPDRFRVGPGPTGKASTPSATGGNVEVYAYSSFAIKVGNTWYFFAEPQVSPAAYASFIAATITSQQGGAATPPPSGTPNTTTNAQRQASLSSTPAGSTPAQASAAGCLSSTTTAKYGATNNGYVAAVQNALRQKGYNLGATGPNGNGVDGDFGPLTLAALNKWQGSKGVLNQNFGCGKVIVDKQMGPAVYKALGITAPASVGGSSAPPPASSGGSGGSGGGSGGGSKKGTTGHTVNPTGTWSGSGSTAKAYASVDGKNVLEKVPLAGGTLTIDGVVVTWGQAPGYSSGGGIFAGLFDDLAKALNTTPQNVELGAAGVVLLGVTLAVTQGSGKR